MGDQYDPYAITTDRDYSQGGSATIGGYYDAQSVKQGPYEHTTFSKTFPGDGGKDSARDGHGGASARAMTSTGQRPLSPLSSTLRDAQGASQGAEEGQLMQGWLWKLYGEGPHAEWRKRWCVKLALYLDEEACDFQ